MARRPDIILASLASLALTALCACSAREDLATGAPGADADAPPIASAPPGNEASADGFALVGPPTPVVEAKPAGKRAAAASSPPPVPASAPEEAAAEPPPLSDAGLLWRADGRPVWWLAAPVREQGRAFITAEAMGSDMRAARRAAVEAGRVALRAALGADPADARVESYLERRLPGDGSGRTRYVGYVKMSAHE